MIQRAIHPRRIMTSIDNNPFSLVFVSPLFLFPSDHQKLEREARICRLLKHPNIGELRALHLKYTGWCKTTTHIFRSGLWWWVMQWPFIIQTLLWGGERKKLRVCVCVLYRCLMMMYLCALPAESPKDTAVLHPRWPFALFLPHYT